MKKFVLTEALIISVTLVLCLYSKTLTDDKGISSMKTITDIKACECDNISMISTTDELSELFEDFNSGNADTGLGLYDTTIFVGIPEDDFNFSKGSTFCTIDVDEVIQGEITDEKIDVEIKGGFYYESQTDYEERLMNAEDEEINTPSERLFLLNFCGTNFMTPGKKYLIIAQTLDIDGIKKYRINGYQISWLCTENTESEAVKEEYTYANYCENEIFSPEQEIIDEFYRLKEEILWKYIHSPQLNPRPF